MNRMYDELAEWWPLLSPPEDYAEELASFQALIGANEDNQPRSLLELGSGGGNNASFLKHAFTTTTLTDLSPRMLEISRRLNPDCEHVVGDMRTLRLGRAFDVVFVHDAIDYMTNEADLRAAVQTVFIHCAPGGLALLVPDHVRETFEPYTEHGGSDGNGRSLRYLEWCYDPDPTDHTVVSEFVFLLRDGDEQPTLERERHLSGLFQRDTWLSLLDEAGFTSTWHIDPEGRCVFLAHKT